MKWNITNVAVVTASSTGTIGLIRKIKASTVVMSGQNTTEITPSTGQPVPSGKERTIKREAEKIYVQTERHNIFRMADRRRTSAV